MPLTDIWIPPKWRALHALELELGVEGEGNEVAEGPRAQVPIDEDKREIELSGVVSNCDCVGAFGSRGVSEALAELGAGPISVRINSPGGSVFEGFAIYNLLREHEGEVTTIANALAASAASVIFSAGDNRLVARGGRVMIHNSRIVYLALVTAREIREDSDKIGRMLDSLDDDIAGIIAEASKLTKPQALEAMEAETWYNSSEAIKIGLATKEYERRATGQAIEPQARELLLGKWGASEELLAKMEPEPELKSCTALANLAANSKRDNIKFASEAHAILADRVLRDYQRQAGR